MDDIGSQSDRRACDRFREIGRGDRRPGRKVTAETANCWPLTATS
ncbi:hypothetical protein BZL30_9303 [Mycobacterium kansasii]|uniref:Uncharacterized protein n=1 Tax=Mycobacterium kansasii TaxID=1768 RepID=A0A1V3WB20_MYCKA|nr:hypothetical protein BZL30_9303 [Mycobacterium kansasii]OOK77085.1 hypothetical protein BZL29_3437 [Mycobacterium kansasii]